MKVNGQRLGCSESKVLVGAKPCSRALCEHAVVRKQINMIWPVNMPPYTSNVGCSTPVKAVQHLLLVQHPAIKVDGRSPTCRYMMEWVQEVRPYLHSSAVRGSLSADVRRGGKNTLLALLQLQTSTVAAGPLLLFIGHMSGTSP